MKSKDIFKYIEEYFNDYLLEEASASSNTIENYKFTFKLLFKFIEEQCGFSIKNLNFDRFTKKFILDFLYWLENDRNNSISTRNMRLASIKSFVSYVFMHEINNRELYLILKIKSKKEPKTKIEALTNEQTKQLLSSINLSNRRGRRHGAMLNLLYQGAFRIDELLSLKCSDINLKKREIHIRHAKGNKQRTVIVPQKTIDIIKIYLKDNKLTQKSDSYLFFNSRKGKLTSNAIRKILKEYVNKAKEKDFNFPKAHPHKFRHSKATHLIDKNINVIEVKEFLGHANLSTTQIYVTTSMDKKREAVETIESQVIDTKSKKDDKTSEWLDNLGI